MMRRMRPALGFILILIPVSAMAQVPHPTALPGDLPDPPRAQLAARHSILLQQRDTLRANVEAHNAKCRAVPKDSSAATQCASAQSTLNTAVREYMAAVRAFNADVEAASHAAIKAAAITEQDEFERMNAAWMRKQEQLIREAVERNRAWTNEVLTAFQALRAPAEHLRPKTLRDLQPGDIVLMSPVGASGTAIAEADRLQRMTELFANGDVFRGRGADRYPLSHAVTVVKSVGGQFLFLDNTTHEIQFARKEGQHILTEREFLASYGGRATFVARPQAVVDGRKLWAAASDAASRGPGFGLFGNRVVCSEAAAIAVAKATGLPLERNRIGPVDTTPADFFDDQGIGKYFLVSPIAKPPKP